jgi:hypothetical protein
MITHKVVVAAVPYVNTGRPLAAPAVLKASLIHNNIDCVALDLNNDIENKIQNSPNKKLFVDFFDKQIIHEKITYDLALMINFCADEILLNNPTIVALSLFCYTCQIFTSWLSAALKQRSPGIKIVIGGPGIQVMSGAMIFNYPEKLKRLGLIDDYITGDGEISLVEYVKGNLEYPGINSSNWKPIENLNSMPIPDYSDYRWFRYSEQSIPIIDSRGCVQSCEFCDVIAFWKKFQYLTAESIFQQMLTQIKKYKFSRFDFRSSISNGNLKEFKKLLQLISNYNKENYFASERIMWDGSFIIRPKSQHDEEFFQLIKDSNPDRLFVGVESVVERVRIGLGKHFSNDDLDHFLSMTQKYEIPVNLLLIVAYPTETVEDYEFSKQWFREHSRYANNSVMHVQLSDPQILPGSELIKNIDTDEFNLTKFQRKAYHNELQKVIIDSGFVIQNYTLLDYVK